MSFPPQKFRELVLQILYSKNIETISNDALILLLMEELKISKKNVKEAEEKALKVQISTPEIDAIISDISTSYDFSRIHKVTLSILRLAIYELLFEKTVPPKVVIAEAIRLSRKFNTPESAGFVNALLDHLYRKSLGEKTNAQDLIKETAHFIQMEEDLLKIAEENSADTGESET